MKRNVTFQIHVENEPEPLEFSGTVFWNAAANSYDMEVKHVSPAPWSHWKTVAFLVYSEAVKSFAAQMAASSEASS